MLAEAEGLTVWLSRQGRAVQHQRSIARDVAEAVVLAARRQREKAEVLRLGRMVECRWCGIPWRNRDRRERCILCGGTL